MRVPGIASDRPLHESTPLLSPALASAPLRRPVPTPTTPTVRPQEACYHPTAARAALEVAAEALFDPRIAGDFMSYRRQSEAESSTFPSARTWAGSLARLLQRGPIVSLVDDAITVGQAALRRFQPHARRAGIPLGREERRAGVEGLAALHARLLEDAHDPAWITVIAFALGRLIAAEASQAAARATESAADEAWAQLDRAYANAAAPALERLLAQGPMAPDALAVRLGEGAPDALGTLAALVPEGALFAPANESDALTRQEFGL